MKKFHYGIGSERVLLTLPVGKVVWVEGRGETEKNRAINRSITIVIPLFEILRQSRYFLSGKKIIPLDRRQGIGERLCRSEITGSAGQVEGRVSTKVPQCRICTCQN